MRTGGGGARISASTAMDYALFSPRRVFTRGDLIAMVWEDSCFVSERTIDSHIKGIRRKFTKIDATADPIETVFGVGYRARTLK